MKRIALLVLFIVLAAPLRVFASAEDKCATNGNIGETYCTCDNGADVQVLGGTSEDEVSCNEACFEWGGQSWVLEQCADPGGDTPLDRLMQNEATDPEETGNGDTAGGATGDASGTVTNQNDLSVPELNVAIPGFSGFSDPTQSESSVTDNFLASYINAVYSYAIGAGALIAVVLMMIGGLQYALARGKSKYIEAAKERIRNAVTGLVLLLAAYDIGFLINPNIVSLKSLTIKSVKEIQLNEGTAGDEGATEISPGTGDWMNLSEPYRSIVQAAQENGSCSVEGGLTSPTGKLPNQGKHHWYDRGRNGDWQKINNLDWAAPWGQAIAAPFDGTVTYQKQTNTDNLCGNRIYLKSTSGASITICHAKDFTDDSGTYSSSRQVKRGETLGHLGGVCCAGYTAPSSWVTVCNSAGTACSDPTKSESCTCQPIQQSGNTTGPHVHITWNSGGNILSCLAAAGSSSSSSSSSGVDYDAGPKW